jgi:prepilin-type N-terminal cleavage/methylation domain-containing protein
MKTRKAFTLMELLTVIGVIALLLALTAAGVMNVAKKHAEAANTAEMKELEESLGNFYARYQRYPPDRVKLCHLLGDYDPVVDRASVDVLQRIWPQLFKLGRPIAWAGYQNGAMIPLPLGGATLDDDQTLVFFLGGPQGVRGFSESVTSPIGDPGLAYTRVAFYDFQPSRLTQETFPRLLDNFRKTTFGHRAGKVYLK